MKKNKRQKPRLPEECRERLRSGEAHRDKKKYKREKYHESVRDNPDAFLFPKSQDFC